ncbi:MAG: hypothetical protein DRP45_01505 [Candidatus Zixiibacteriota bacterium]|nr:MAG: hypothetical protein DRP45_01505 [candidate division Zixibacteria bacterium]
MRTTGKIALLLSASFLAVMILTSVAQAQAIKIGFIDDERIKTDFKEWERAQEQWELERSAWDEQAEAIQVELQELIEEYERQKLILSEEKKLEREGAIRSKSDSLDYVTRAVYSPGGLAEQKQMELIGPLLEKVNKAIEAVAIDNDFDVVFTMQSGLGYIKESFDITDKVLEQLEKIED